MKKYRVFTNTLGWSDVIYIFDFDITYSEIKAYQKTKYLDKNSFVGIYEFDQNFLNLFNKSEINNKPYYYKFMYRRDDIPLEEKLWKSIPDFKK